MENQEAKDLTQNHVEPSPDKGGDINDQLNKLKTELIDKFNLLKLDLETRFDTKLNNIAVVQPEAKVKSIQEMDEHELPKW